MMKKTKKAVAVFLSVLMVFTCVPSVCLLAFASGETSDPVTVLAFSDFQYPNTDVYGLGAAGNAGGRIVLSSVLARTGVTSAAGLICAGDYDHDLNRSAGDTADGIGTIKSVIGDIVPESGQIFAQGNHDPMSTDGGTAQSGNNDPASGDYGVFVINERDYMWNSSGMSEATVKNTAESLRRYLNNKLAVGFTAPVFIVSHLPLHYSMRTSGDGDKMFANYIFDVLNEAGENGLNVFYLYGHDHSNGWDDYLGGSKVFLTKGDKLIVAQRSKTVFEEKTLAFTYMNPGFMGYYENHNSASGTVGTYYDIADLSMSVFTITGSDVQITRYNVNGMTELKKAGVYNYYKGEQDKSYSPDTSVVSSPRTVALSSVTDKSHEIGAVVPVVTQSAEQSGTVYTALSSYSQLTAGSVYLLGAMRNGEVYLAMPVLSGSTGRLEGVKTAADNGVNAGSVISDTSGEAVSGGSVDLTDCEWQYNGSAFLPVTGDNAGRYIDIPDSSTAALSFTDHNVYTVTDTLKDTDGGYLNLRSNCLFSSYESGTTLTYFVKGEAGENASSGEVSVLTRYAPSTSGQYVAEGDYFIRNTDGHDSWLGSGTSPQGGLTAVTSDADALCVHIAPANVSSNTYYVTTVSGGTTYYLSVGRGTNASDLTWTTTRTATAITENSSYPGLVGFKNSGASYYMDSYASDHWGVWSDGMSNVNERFALYSRQTVSEGGYSHYTAVSGAAPVTDGTYIIYNSGRSSVLTGSAGASGHITAQTGYTPAGSTLDAPETNEFTFTLAEVSGSEYRYYIRTAAGRYMSIGSANGNISFTDTPALTAVKSLSGDVALYAPGTNYYLDFYSATDVSSYSASSPNNNETQTLYRRNYRNGTWYYAGTDDITRTVTETVTKYTAPADGEYYLSASGTDATANSPLVTLTQNADGTCYARVNGSYIRLSSSGVSYGTSPQALTAQGGADGYFTLGDGDGNYLTVSGSSLGASRAPALLGAYTLTQVEHEEPVYGERPTTVQETRYVLATSVSANKTYVFVSTNAASTGAHSLTNKSGTAADTSIRVYAADDYSGVYVKDPDAGAVWTANASGNYFRFKNDKYYITYRNSFSLNTSTNNNRADWTVGNSASSFRNRGTNTQYLRWSGSAWGTSNSSSNRVYLYTPQSVSISGTETVQIGTQTVTEDVFVRVTDLNSHTEEVQREVTGVTDIYAMVAPHAAFSVPNGAETQAVNDLLTTGGDDVSPVSVQLSFSSDGASPFPADFAADGVAFDLSAVNTAKAGTYTVPVTITTGGEKYEIGSLTLNVSAEKNILSASLSAQEGTVYAGASRLAKTGVTLTVEYEGGTSGSIPVTVAMLLGASGNPDVSALCGVPGDYSGLGVFLDRGNGYWFPDFTLHVIQRDDYPEYPDEGSVKVGKTGRGVDFQTTGVAQIELTATGVPMNKGIDIVLMVDTSSSMNSNTITETVTDASGRTTEVTKTRLEVMKEAVTNLIGALSAPNSATGEIPDIKMAIADFNGYGTQSGSEHTYVSTLDHLAGGQMRTDYTHGGVLTGSESIDANAYVPIEELAAEFDVDSKIRYSSGTNYDAAFEYIYKLTQAKQNENLANQDDREVYVIFMSDGAPFQYNYFSSQSTDAQWNDWLKGTYADYTQVPADSADAHTYFYNGQGNLNRMAQAIKGDPGTLYTVIDRECENGTVDVTGDGVNDAYMTQVKGLGARMYSIGFCLAVDTAITVDSMEYVLETTASSPEDYYTAENAAELNGVFYTIANQVVQAATDAYFTDTMGAAYDLQTATEYTVVGERHVLETPPVITVTDYTIYTRADYNNGVIDDFDLIGTRTGDLTVLETVTFSPDGTRAFSDKIGGATDIMVDGVIYGKTFTYNNKKDASVKLDRDGDGIAEFTLAAETFCWNIGIIADTEYSLSYYVYLTGSMEGERDAGSYATNASAVLYYTNYLGKPCHKDTVSPILPWEAATVNYEFYLVNADGEPVNSAGTVVPFENRVKIGLTQSKTVLLNADETDTAYTLRASSEIPEGYRLFNNDAAYYICVGSGENTSTATILDDASVVTTCFYEAGRICRENGDVSGVNDYGNTHIAFAVLWETSLVPDTVVADFGLPVVIHTLGNDIALPAGSKINAIGTALTENTALYDTAYDSSRLTDASVVIETERYTASAEDANVRFSLNDMLLSCEAVFYYEVKLGAKYYYSSVTVIPADIVYYEENFVTFTDGKPFGEDGRQLTWSPVGDGSALACAVQDEDRPGTFAAVNDANNVYGYDSHYESDTYTYSLGAAMETTVVKNSLGSEPTASFTFCGTGFDLISVTSALSGAIMVEVTPLAGGKAKNYIVDTYYGYSYGRMYLDADGNTTLHPCETDENGRVIRENTVIYDGPDARSMQTQPTYRALDGTVSTTVTYYAPESTQTHPVYTLTPTYYAPDGSVTRTPYYYGADGDIAAAVTTEPAFAYAYAYCVGWVPSDNADDALYQVPVCTVSGLAYGSYRVLITPKYLSLFDSDGDGSTTFCLDAVRIYDPCGVSDGLTPAVEDAYLSDNEADAHYTELRDNVLEANDLFVNGDESTNYAIYIDGFSSLGRETTVSDDDAMKKYLEAGPNNELYLGYGQAVAFNLSLDAPCLPASVQIGAKLASAGETCGANGTVLITNSASDEAYEIAINGANDLYRDITPYVVWNHDVLESTGTYVTKYPIVIMNNSDAIISLTNIKWTLGKDRFTQPDGGDPANVMTLMSSAPVRSYALSALNEYVFSQPVPLDVADISIEWENTDLTEGASAVLVITTPDTVGAVTIGSSVFTEYEQTADGARRWTYRVTVTPDTPDTFFVTFTDIYGRETSPVATEKITVTPDDPDVPEEPDVPDAPEYPEDTDAPEIPGVRDTVGSVTERLRSIFERIFEALKSLISLFGSFTA